VTLTTVTAVIDYCSNHPVLQGVSHTGSGSNTFVLQKLVLGDASGDHRQKVSTIKGRRRHALSVSFWILFGGFP
jgi:hypothetical protein